jgi:hypothetical protein
VYGANRDEVTDENILEFWTDADHAGEVDKAKSRTGILVKAFGDTIQCISKLQGAVTNSTTHSEMKAMAHLARHSEFYRNLMADFGYEQTIPTRLYTDSETLKKSLLSGKVCSDMVHMLTDFNQIIENIAKKRLFVIHIPGISNPSDIFTKPLASDSHGQHTAFVLNDATFPISPVPPLPPAAAAAVAQRSVYFSSGCADPAWYSRNVDGTYMHEHTYQQPQNASRRHFV